MKGDVVTLTRRVCVCVCVRVREREREREIFDYGKSTDY